MSKLTNFGVTLLCEQPLRILFVYLTIGKLSDDVGSLITEESEGDKPADAQEGGDEEGAEGEVEEEIPPEGGYVIITVCSL